MKNVLFVALVLAAFASHSPAASAPSEAMQFSVLGHALGETIQDAQVIAEQNNMPLFSCWNEGDRAKLCTAKTMDVPGVMAPKLTFSFLDGRLTQILYEFLSTDFETVMGTLQEKYGVPIPPKVKPAKGVKSGTWGSPTGAHLFVMLDTRKSDAMASALLADEKNEEFEKALRNNPKI